MKIKLFKLLFLKKKVTCVSFCHKDFKKHLLIKVSIKTLSEYICRQLKQHQQKIRDKTNTSLQIIVLWYLIVPYSIPSSTKILFFFGTSTIFVYFNWHPLSVCYGGKSEHFTVPSERRGPIFFLRTQMYIFSSTFIKRFKPLSATILSWEAHC